LEKVENYDKIAKIGRKVRRKTADQRQAEKERRIGDERDGD